MYKYEKRKDCFKSEPYLFDYSCVYGTKRHCCDNDSGRHFLNSLKKKKHLEKPKQFDAFKLSDVKSSSDAEYSPRSQGGGKKISGLFRFMAASVTLTAFLIVFAIAMSVFDKGDEAWNLKNYDDMIWPVVMQDPKPFDENCPPDNETMLKASLWELAMDRKNSNNSWNSEQQLVISKSDVESAGKKLFGKETNFSGINPEGSDFYKFDDSRNAFLVEPISGTDGFLPHTVTAKHEGDDVILKVGYVSPKNQFSSSMDSVYNNRVEKYAKYRLKKNANTGNFYVLSVN
jgi:hypothetical protein